MRRSRPSTEIRNSSAGGTKTSDEAFRHPGPRDRTHAARHAARWAAFRSACAILRHDRTQPEAADSQDVEPPSPAVAQTSEVTRSVAALIPALRGFARSLTRDPTEADDLLQETLTRALANLHQFTPGTNLKAWLFAILRNTHISIAKKRGRERSLLSGVEAEDVGMAPPQPWIAATGALRAALAALPADQRDVVVLIGGFGLSYDECAEVCGCAIGTIKSRLNRARSKLAEALDAQSVDDLA